MLELTPDRNHSRLQSVQRANLPTAMDCPCDKTLILANTPTRSRRVNPLLQERILNWGLSVLCVKANHEEILTQRTQRRRDRRETETVMGDTFRAKPLRTGRFSFHSIVFLQ